MNIIVADGVQVRVTRRCAITPVHLSDLSFPYDPADQAIPARQGSGEAISSLGENSCLFYLIIEHFKNNDPVPVYRRFKERGRLAPEGLRYVSSWVDEKLERCFQVMETDDPQQLDEWIGQWSDLVEFEIYPVITSNEAAERVARLL